MPMKEKLKMLSGLVRPGVIPILDYVKIGGGAIEATDLETTILVDESGLDFEPVLVEYKRFRDTISLLDDYTLSLCNETLTITTLSGEFNLPTLPADDYPVTNFPKPDVSFGVSKQLVEKMKITQQFVSNDELMPAFRGVSMLADSGKLEFCASDRYRLFIFDEQVECNDFSVILPVSFIRNIPVSSGVIYIGDDKVSFKADGFTVCSRVIDERYPNYRIVLPTMQPTSVAQFKQPSLLKLVKQASVYADKSTRSVKFFSDKTIKISALDADFNVSCELDTGIPGELRASFDSKFLIDVLNVLSEDIVLSFWSSDIGVLFSDNSKKCLLMPLIN